MCVRLFVGATPEEMVSSIYSVKGARGGKFVEDQFDIVASDLVAGLVNQFNRIGHGALVFREQQSTAVMLVPPLTFTFKSRRNEDGESVSAPTELVVTGHFMCLVHREGKQPRWAFDDGRAEYAAENKLAYKKALASALEELGPGVVPMHLLSFVSLLNTDSSDED